MEIIVLLVILIFSAILHEVAHGYIADRLGDPTARLMGRLTLDPRPHIDPFMSIAIPLLLLISNSPILFGGAKPVPVDPFNLKEGRKDVALVALAGPLTNVVLAVVASLIVKVFSSPLDGIFLYVVHINLLLAILNLMPIPPLDGSKIFALLLPEETAARYLNIGQMGFFILIFLLYATPLGSLFSGLLHFAEKLLLSG